MISTKKNIQDKPKELEPINYYYLAISVIVLIICYYYLCYTDNKLHIKKIEKDNIESKSIKVITLNGEIMMDPNIFEMHIKRMRGNIFELNKKFTKGDCKNIKNYLDNTKSNINSYININTNNMDPNFCNMNSDIRLVDNNILQEIELLRNKLTKVTENDLNGDISNESMKYSMLEILIDMDIILSLVRSSMCKNGVLDLLEIDNLIIELYKNNCAQYDSNINTKFNKSPELGMHLIPDSNSNNLKKIINSDTNRYTTNSQDIDYGNSIEFENNLLKNNIIKNINNKENNLILTSHEKISEFDDNINGSNLNNIFNINKLNGVNINKQFSMFRDTNKIDNTGRTSLTW